MRGIGDYAFSECLNLTNVVISNGVAQVGSAAFSSTSLTNVTLPKSATNLGSLVFAGCTGLTNIAVDAQNPSYRSTEGVLFNSNQTVLVAFPEGKVPHYFIPDGVTHIGTESFFCSSLTEITFPSSVLYVEDRSFAESALADVIIPDSVVSIGRSAFYGCDNLVSVTMGNAVTNLGGNTFYQCDALARAYFRGAAPAYSLPLFYNTFGPKRVVVYYLPGTSGWSGSFAGAGTALWRPHVLTSDADFGVRTNQFGFNISWASGQAVVVEGCINLAEPDWLPLQTNTLTGNSIYFSDPEWANAPSRFYRLRSQ